ncbi:MAG: hypothetical protein HY532_01895 [Chloroflexi bacterium]|nr:hypothetical protein [Chloroflexota bacterium]
MTTATKSKTSVTFTYETPNPLAPPLIHLDGETFLPPPPEPEAQQTEPEAPQPQWKTDGRAQRLYQGLNTATSDIFSALYAAKARLLVLLQEEIQSMFVEILTTKEAWGIPLLEEQGIQMPAAFKQAAVVHPAPVIDPPDLNGQAPYHDAAPPSVQPVETEEGQPEVFTIDNAPQARQETPAPDHVYEGTVQLRVSASGRVRQSMQFAHDLGQMPHLNVLRLMGDLHNELDLWVGLREPLPLGLVLAEMQNVTSVEVLGVKEGETPLLLVSLQA